MECLPGSGTHHGARNEGPEKGNSNVRPSYFGSHAGAGSDLDPKSNPTTLGHWVLRPLRTVILSAAKNLTARPFTPFRVTILVCQSLEARFSGPENATAGQRDLTTDCCYERSCSGPGSSAFAAGQGKVRI